MIFLLFKYDKYTQNASNNRSAQVHASLGANID